MKPALTKKSGKAKHPKHARHVKHSKHGNMVKAEKAAPAKVTSGKATANKSSSDLKSAPAVPDTGAVKKEAPKAGGKE